MSQIIEAQRILNINRIPYGFVGEELKGETLNLPTGEIDRLRKLGFRVGKALFQDAHVVFFKGKCVGITAG